MKTLCKYLAGSHSYGLSTPTSDEDVRTVFCNTDVGQILGLEKLEHIDIKSDEKDEFHSELRHFLKGCRKNNTAAVELLFNKNWMIITPEWELIQKNREKLLDSEGMFKCLRGYIYGERRLFNGERLGEAGAKRREAIARYGYSPKNCVQILRLIEAGKTFFNEGFFPVHMDDFPDKYLKGLLMGIKLSPQNHKKEELTKLIDEQETKLVESFESRSASYKFDTEFANDICYELYMPILRASD